MMLEAHEEMRIGNKVSGNENAKEIEKSRSVNGTVNGLC